MQINNTFTTKFHIKEGIINGPQISEYLKNVHFEDSMTLLEQETWVGFKKVVNNLLENNKYECYEEIIRKYEALGAT